MSSKRPADEQLEIDLLNAFYKAYKAGVSEEQVDDAIEYARENAREDADE